MSEHTILRKSRNAFSSFLHVFLKIALAVASVFITLISGSPIIGIILVFISKWRIFAVRPRFWSLNIRSNLLDFTVGISFVLLAYIAGTELSIAHIIITALYTLWLVYIKSRTSDSWIIAQSLICIFFGSMAAIFITSTVDTIFLVLAMLIIGYSSARHIFAQVSNVSLPIITAVCALLCAEIGWICSGWNIIYDIPVIDVMIPQASIIITIMSYAFAKTTRSISRNDGKFVTEEALPPIIFSLITVSILIIFFSNPIFNI